MSSFWIEFTSYHNGKDCKLKKISFATFSVWIYFSKKSKHRSEKAIVYEYNWSKRLNLDDSEC